MSLNIKFVSVFGLLMAFISLVSMHYNSEQIPIDDPDMLDLLYRHEKEMNCRMNSSHIFLITEVIDAKRELENGYKYYVDFQFGQTDCLKVDNPDLADCDTYTLHLPFYAVIHLFEGESTLETFRCQIPSLLKL